MSHKQFSVMEILRSTGSRPRVSSVDVTSAGRQAPRPIISDLGKHAGQGTSIDIRLRCDESASWSADNNRRPVDWAA